MRIGRKITPETALKRAIRGYLTATGWFNFPVLQGLGSYPGIPDIIAVKSGFVAFIEVKAPGGVQSPVQKQFEQQVKDHGCFYYLIRSIDELINDPLFKQGRRDAGIFKPQGT